MLQKSFKIVRHRAIRDEYFKIAFHAPEIASRAKPGQFVMVKVNTESESAPLLRRPLSIHGVEGSKIELLYKVLGRGSEILSRKKVGASIDILGPLGNSFTLSPETYHLKPILVAGGMGVAPLTFLAEKLMEGKAKEAKGKILVLIGAKTKNQLLCEDEFKNLGCDVKIATDDGSKGFHGHVTDLLETYREPRTENREPILYACGPEPMLESVADFALRDGLDAEGSFERHMACGIGACAGCAIKAKALKPSDEHRFLYKRVCYDGPVFKLNQIIF